MFNNCPAIIGTGDDTAAAELLVAYADKNFGCSKSDFVILLE